MLIGLIQYAKLTGCWFCLNAQYQSSHLIHGKIANMPKMLNYSCNVLCDVQVISQCRARMKSTAQAWSDPNLSSRTCIIYLKVLILKQQTGRRNGWGILHNRRSVSLPLCLFQILSGQKKSSFKVQDEFLRWTSSGSSETMFISLCWRGWRWGVRGVWKNWQDSPTFFQSTFQATATFVSEIIKRAFEYATKYLGCKRLWPVFYFS